MECVFGSDNHWDKRKIKRYVSEGQVYNCSEEMELDNYQWSKWREKYSGENVRECLWELVEQPKGNLEGYVFLYQESFQKKKFCDILLCVDPICAALALEDYECAERLLEADIGVKQEKEPEKYILLNEYTHLNIRNIYISQFLFISDIPAELYQRIWEQMPFRNYVNEDFKYICKFYEIEQDYICNPMLKEETSWENLTDLIERIHKLSPEGLQSISSEFEGFAGFFKGLKSRISFPISLDISAADIIFRLLQIFQGEWDVKKIIEYISWYFLYSGKRQAWVPVALKVSEKCLQMEGVRKSLVNSLFGLLIRCMEDKHWDRSLEKCEKKVILALKNLCTPEYTQEDFLKYMSTEFSRIHFSGWHWDLFTIWRKELKRELRPHRADTYLHVIFNKAINRALESFDKSIEDLMLFLESLTGIDDSGSSKEEIMEETRIVMEDILRIGSEEALLLCWKNGIITKETLPMVSEMAIKDGHTKFLPLLIYLQATTKAKNACP